MKNNIESFQLVQLGAQTECPKTPKEAKLEAIPNLWLQSNYTVQLICEEFTCLCPVTGQPDFAKIIIEYTPGPFLVESKSLKLYLGSYRNEGIFHEFVVNAICNDLIKLLSPKKLDVRGEFSVRGGIRIIPKATYVAS
jgi:7-cyano-7-deazaguanine reductase